jgi:hypothetical protein
VRHRVMSSKSFSQYPPVPPISPNPSTNGKKSDSQSSDLSITGSNPITAKRLVAKRQSSVTSQADAASAASESCDSAFDAEVCSSNGNVKGEEIFAATDSVSTSVYFELRSVLFQI